MKVYTPRELQVLLNIGRPAVYEIMREYGFRTGYTTKSPLRITEEGVRAWIEANKTITDSQRTQ